MGAFFINLVWSLLVTLISRELFAPDQTQQDAALATAGDVDAPTIDEGSSIPIIFGSVLTGRQNVSWYGGLGNEPIVQSGVTTGYKYRLTAQCSLCVGPVDDIREVRFEDNPVGATRVATGDYWDYTIDQPDLFGGIEREGGVAGTMRVYRGTTTQTADVELGTLANALLPAYRHVCYAVLYDMYIGTSPRLKSPSFLVERCPNTLGIGGGRHIVGSHRDSNAVCTIYDLLTNSIWGAAIPTDQFATARWLAAAETAYAEGLGISMSLSSASDVDSTIQALVRYLDAVIYDDPATGLIDIQLVRESDLTSAPALTSEHVESVSVSRISWVDLKSTVKVTYTDESRNYETGGVMAQNSAVVRALGGAVDLETAACPGFTSASVSQQAATRLLRSLSYPMSKVEVRGDRTLATLRVGQPFRLTWTRPNVSAYYRATRVDFGSSTDPWPTVSGVEDVFAAASNTFTPPTTGGGGAVGAQALPISRSVLLETPYFLRRNDGRSVIYGAAQPNSSHTGFKVAGDEVLYNWMASAPITADIPQWSGATLPSLTLTMSPPVDVDTPTPAEIDAGQALLLVGSELMSYATVTRNGDSTVTFATLTRGVLDTVPVEHTVGELAVVLLTCRMRKSLDLPADAAVSVAARTFTAADSQTAEEATVHTIATASRAARPLPPGGLRINGTLWDAGPHTEALVSWAPRSRQTAAVVAQDATGYTAEAGTDYMLRVYRGDALLAAYTTSGTSHVLTQTGSLVLTLHARRGGLVSYQGHRLALTVTVPADHLLLEDGSYLLQEDGGRVVLDA